MRSVAFAPAGVVFRQLARRAHTLLVSGIVVGMMNLWRAAAAVISDICANCAQDVLNSWAGRVGEWLIIAGVLAAYTWHARRRRRQDKPPTGSHPLLRNRAQIQRVNHPTRVRRWQPRPTSLRAARKTGK